MSNVYIRQPVKSLFKLLIVFLPSATPPALRFFSYSKQTTMSTPGKTHPSVIPPPPIKKIINNKRTLYIPALQAPRQLFNEVEGGTRFQPRIVSIYTHTSAFRVWRYLHGIAPCFSSRRSIHQPHSVISLLIGPIVLKKFNRRPMTIHTLVHLYIYVSAAGRSMYIPNTPFVLSYSILNHGIEIKWNKRGKSNILLHNISSRELFLAQSHIWRAPVY